MRIVVLSHMDWMNMLCHQWSLAGVEIVKLSLDVASMVQDERARTDGARAMAAALRRLKPDLVLDVNAAGLLPMDEEASQWTSDEVDCPWCLWWWDAPHASLFPRHNPREISSWLRAVRRPHVTHFMWDATLAREYSVWLDKPVHWLPTATHPGLFHPDAARLAERPFNPVDVAFLGTWYEAPVEPAPAEIARMASARLQDPDRTWFDWRAEEPARWPALRQVLDGVRAHPLECFSPSLLTLRARVEQRVGEARRTRPLDAIRARIPSCRFMGRSWPARFQAVPTPIYQPVHLVACYQNAAVCLELKSAQAFTGSAMRAYEIMGSGAVMACMEPPDFDREGRLRNSAYLSFSTADELADLCAACRGGQGPARAIRANARQYVLENHTWNHRLASLLGVIGSQVSRAATA